jgi:hypothetical protein
VQGQGRQRADLDLVEQLLRKSEDYRILADPGRRSAHWLLHRNERLAGPHDDRFREVHLAALANGGGRQQAQALAGAGVDPEDFYPPPGLDAFQVEARDDPVVRKSEGEPGVFVERDHPAFFLTRIIASFARRVIALIAASRFKAEF